MTELHTEKINQAVRDCLSYCYSQPKPLSAVAACMAGLRRRDGWIEADVLRVQQTVLRMLSALIEQPDELDDLPPN